MRTTLIMLTMLIIGACSNPDNSEDPEITDFTFTAASGLQAGNNSAAAESFAGTLSASGGTAP
jgi:hypothetical protein